MGRGWISEDASEAKAINKSYYLYTGEWFLTLSSFNLDEAMKSKVVFVGAMGDLNGFWVGSRDEGNGGVQILELCY